MTLAKVAAIGPRLLTFMLLFWMVFGLSSCSAEKCRFAERGSARETPRRNARVHDSRTVH